MRMLWECFGSYSLEGEVVDGAQVGAFLQGASGSEPTGFRPEFQLSFASPVILGEGWTVWDTRTCSVVKRIKRSCHTLRHKRAA